MPSNANAQTAAFSVRIFLYYDFFYIAQDSEIEVFPFQDSESDDAKVCHCHVVSILTIVVLKALEDEPDYMRAWGNQKKLFYDGNQSSDGSDNENDLEQEDVDLAETRQSKIMKESDFQLHWLDLAVRLCFFPPNFIHYFL